tara:strand:- start:930 stop:1181 length:252 start_codon:yes stop_codon:yes gene_type:complete
MTTCEHGNYREEPTHYECKTCGNVIEKRDNEMTQGDYITIAMDYLNFNREERIYWAETASHNSIAFFTYLGRNVHNGHVFKED